MVSLLAPASRPHAQRPPAAPFTIEQLTTDRWITARQQPRFTPFREARTWIHVADRSVDSAGTMALRLTFEPATRLAAEDLTVGLDGHIIRAVPTIRPLTLSPGGAPTDTMGLQDGIYFDQVPQRWFIMPEARVWDLVPVVRAASLARGMRWTDTLNLSAAAGDFAQALSGVRTSVVKTDTIVGGRQLWIVEDSMNAAVTEHYVQDESSLGVRVTIERTARGSIRGRHLFDPSLRLFRSRSDSMALIGNATLRYPDGRTFTTPVRYERWRRFTLHTADAFVARQQALRVSPELPGDRSANAPLSDVQLRLNSNDVALRDSLLSVWDHSQNPNERQRIFMLLATFAGRADPTIRDTLDLRAIQAGDSVARLARLLADPRRWDVPTVRDVLIPNMADPAGAFSLGVPREAFYRSALSALIDVPAAITPDTANWPLSPAVYDYLAQQGRTARDPRLRDLGLVALFVRDPRRWSDSVLARAATTSPMLEDAVSLIRGIGATSASIARPSMPDSGATWRDWLAWMGPIQRRPVAPVMPPLLSRPIPRNARMPFEESHVLAIRMYEARTGRRVVAELQRKLATATDDSARLVFSTMLQGLGESPVDLQQLMTQFQSGSPEFVALARRNLPALFGSALEPSPASPSRIVTSLRPAIADSALSVAIVDRLIGNALGMQPSWRTLERVRGLPPQDDMGPPSPIGRLNTVFLIDSVPPAVVERWRPTATFVRDSEWNARTDNEWRRKCAVSRVVRLGSFMSVRIAFDERLAPNASPGPTGHAGWTRYYLMLLDGEWVIVLMQSAAS
jgi:hypothetical protein